MLKILFYVICELGDAELHLLHDALHFTDFMTIGGSLAQVNVSLKVIRHELEAATANARSAGLHANTWICTENAFLRSDHAMAEYPYLPWLLIFFKPGLTMSLLAMDVKEEFEEIVVAGGRTGSERLTVPEA